MPKTQRLSDATLVRRSQQGDRRSFAALVARYDRRLRGLAHALLLDRGQMDAALGLAYLRAWRDVVRIRPRDDVGPWLYRAVYNACIDQLRRNESPTGDRAARVDVAPGAPGGLRAVLGALAPADRVAVVLVEREGFSVTSAARILGVSPDELETRLDVARDQLAPHVPIPPAEPDPATAPPESADDAADESAHDAADEPADERAASDSAPEPPVPAGAAMNGAATGSGAPEARAADPATTDDPPPGDRATDDAAGKAEPPVDGDPSADGQPATAASGNGQDSDDAGATSAPPAPVDGAEAAVTEGPSAPAGSTNGHTTAEGKTNGHAANRGRGRRARRRANGAAGRTAPSPEPDEVAPAPEAPENAQADHSADEPSADVPEDGPDTPDLDRDDGHQAGPVTST